MRSSADPNYVLHFFPDEEKAQWIQRFYNFLQPAGLLYLRLNTTTHPEILNAENATALGNHTYKPNPGKTPKETYYLSEPEQLLPRLPEYKVLEEYNDRNERNFTRVFKKQ